MQELVAVVLGIETFAQQLHGTLVFNFVHTDGILHGSKNGGAAPEDVSVVVGKLWLQMSKLKIGNTVEAVLKRQLSCQVSTLAE